MKTDTSQKIAIVGAGLAGSLAAIYLARRGFEVEVYEKRPDMRRGKVEGGRSINLALSDRGIRALEEVGVAEEVLKEVIPMKGRMLHSTEGGLTFVPYGKDEQEYINSVSRTGLNKLLMNAAEVYPNVRFFFEHPCEELHWENGQLTVTNLKENTTVTVEAEVIIGADGAASAVRQAMEKQEGYQSSTKFLEHGYKELTIPPEEGTFQLEKNALHIWPRGNYMLIALPNLDGSFTCTLFFPMKGAVSFEGLDTPEKIRAFFKEKFSDVVPLLPRLTEEFLGNPTGILGTVKCFPWHAGRNVFLIGDAAHAIVPFYGQGMNASFEDCRVLDACLEKYKDWDEIIGAYEELRKVNTDAIADLAIENFYEMRGGVAEPAFLLKRELENVLENRYSDYHSKYSLVTFHPEVPYSVAQKRGNQQNELLLEICRKHTHLDELNVEEIYGLLKTKLNF